MCLPGAPSDSASNSLVADSSDSLQVFTACTVHAGRLCAGSQSDAAKGGSDCRAIAHKSTPGALPLVALQPSTPGSLQPRVADNRLLRTANAPPDLVKELANAVDANGVSALIRHVLIIN